MQTIHTSCEHCCFKELEGERQVGCKLGRLEKFSQQGVELEWKDKGYCIIKNRVCIAIRTEHWAKQQSNIIEAIYKELTPHFDVIIVASKNQTNIKDITKTLRGISQLTCLPRTVRVVVNTHAVNPKEVIKFLEYMNPPYEFFVDAIHIRQKDGDRVSQYRAIDIAADKCESTYYAVFHAGANIPQTFLADIDYAINRRLERFCLLEPNASGNGLVVQKDLHKLVMGHREVVLEEYDDGALLSDNLVDKVKFFSKKSNQSHMIKKVEEICRGL